MSQFKDGFALNCGFQHQGGATCTTAPAVLETKFQFPFTHLDSSFFDAFLEKRILSLSRRLSTPWVQLIFSTPKNKKGERHIAFLDSDCQGTKEELVKANTQKRNERLQALFAPGCLGYARLTQIGRTGTGYPGKQSETVKGCQESDMQRLSLYAQAKPFISFSI